MTKKKHSYKITQPTAYTFSKTTHVPFISNSIDKAVYDGFMLQVSYSHYYDWLKQQETTLANSTLTSTQSLQLTNKHLVVKQPNYSLLYPLHTITKVSVAFKRLLLPLIGGGISTPLFAVAVWNHLFNFWLGIGILMAGLSLLYYGWLGTHQVSIQVAEHQVHYFADQKTQELEQLINSTNKVIRDRKTMTS